MRKPSARIREEIARLQEQLKTAETREAERIGRIALRAGIGDLAIDDDALETAFQGLVRQFTVGISSSSTGLTGNQQQPSRFRSGEVSNAPDATSRSDPET